MSAPRSRRWSARSESFARPMRCREKPLRILPPSHRLQANDCRAMYGPTEATAPSNFLNVCGWKDRKNVAKDLKRIYQAIDDVEAEKALADFAAEWGQKCPSIAPSWRRAWQEVIPFFAFPPAMRKIIYTTTKLIYLAIRSFEKTGRAVREWVAARNQFAICHIPDGSTDDPFQPHGLSLIHRVSDTPMRSAFLMATCRSPISNVSKSRNTCTYSRRPALIIRASIKRRRVADSSGRSHSAKGAA
jgi:hypothetical protein